MPNRILREGINSSPRINALSMGAEILYRRLLLVADDYGRYYANPGTVRGGCWPTHPSPPCEQTVSNLLAECLQGDRPLLTRYTVEGCDYLQITDFNQKIRSKSKFPEPLVSTVRKLLAECGQNADKMPALGVVRSSYAEANALGEFDQKVGAAAERMYARHPKKKELVLVPGALKSAAENSTDRDAKLIEIESVHAEWVKCEEWEREGGRYVESLPRWIADRGFTVRPNGGKSYSGPNPKLIIR